MIEIDLITGILGSGKTTFIKKYVGYMLSKGMKVAIIENDHGAVNVDMMLLKDMIGENCHIETIAGGCDAECHQRRFKTKLISLAMQGFNRIVMEPSGIFDVDEFFDTLNESPVDRWYKIGSIITIVNAMLEDKLTRQLEFLLASQVANTGKIIFSKAQLADKENYNNTLEHINRALREIKCVRKVRLENVLIKDWNELTDADMESIMNCGYDLYSYEKDWQDDKEGSSTFYIMHVRMELDKLKEIIPGLFTEKACGDIFRIKGFMKVENGWIEVNATRQKTTIEKIDEGQEVFIVIGEKLNQEGLDNVFKTNNLNDEYISIESVIQ